MRHILWEKANVQKGEEALPDRFLFHTNTSVSHATAMQQLQSLSCRLRLHQQHNAPLHL